MAMNECVANCLFTQKNLEKAMSFGIAVGMIAAVIACLLWGGGPQSGWGSGDEVPHSGFLEVLALLAIACPLAAASAGVIAFVLAFLGYVAYLFVECMIACEEQSAAEAASGGTTDYWQDILEGATAMGCAEAREALAAANQALADAVARRDAQRAIIDRWERRTRRAYEAMLLAAAAVAATSVWNPVAFAVALAALAAATATWLRLRAASAPDHGIMHGLDLEISAAQAAVNIAQSAVDALCETVTTPPTPEVDAPPSGDVPVPGHTPQ